MRLLRCVPTQFGLASLAKLAAGMWASEQIRLWDIAHELSRLAGDLVTPMQVSQAIEEINANPAGRWCRACGKRLGARVSKRALYCTDECRRRGRSMVQLVAYHNAQGNSWRCQWCNGLLTRGAFHRLFCSRRCCSYAYNARRRETRIGPRKLLPPRACVICGAIFKPRDDRALWCGPECHREGVRRYMHELRTRQIAQAAKERGSERTCPECGATFALTGSVIRVYCGDRCKRQAAHRRRREQRVTPLVKHCPICGTALEMIRGTMTYCGDECRREAARRRDRERYEQSKRARATGDG